MTPKDNVTSSVKHTEVFKRCSFSLPLLTSFDLLKLSSGFIRTTPAQGGRDWSHIIPDLFPVSQLHGAHHLFFWPFGHLLQFQGTLNIFPLLSQSGMPPRPTFAGRLSTGCVFHLLHFCVDGNLLKWLECSLKTLNSHLSAQIFFILWTHPNLSKWF